MNIFTLLSVLNVATFGIICGFTDLRCGKIYNKFIGGGFISGALIAVVFYGRYFGPVYLGAMLVNGVIGILFSFLLWLNKRWSAGDAKLFSFFSFFVPLCYYRHNYIAYFPSINILINTFLILMAYVCIDFVSFMAGELFFGKGVFREREVSVDSVLRFFKIMASYILIIYLLSQGSRIKFLEPIVSHPLVAFCIMVFLYGPVSRNKRVSNALCAASLFVSIFLVAFQGRFFISILYKVVLYVAVIGVVRHCFNFYIRRKETAQIKVEDLRQGQILVKDDLQKINRRVKEKGRHEDYHETSNYGLNAGQIKIIQCLCPPGEVLKVYKTFSLGPLMLAGVLITILTSNSLIQMIIKALPAF